MRPERADKPSLDQTATARYRRGVAEHAAGRRVRPLHDTVWCLGSDLNWCIASGFFESGQPMTPAGVSACQRLRLRKGAPDDARRCSWLAGAPHVTLTSRDGGSVCAACMLRRSGLSRWPLPSRGRLGLP